MTDRRVLITGSRRWPTPLIYLVHGVLDAELRRTTPAGHLTVVHGACPTGADWFAHRWCCSQSTGAGLGVNEEAHPADWDRVCDETCRHRPRFKNGRIYCPQAGNHRNQEMVDLGADVCHAFIVTGTGLSRGTFDCVGRAEAAGIPVIKHMVDVP